MNTPKFWYSKSLLAYLLYPLSLFYRLGFYIDYYLKSKKIKRFEKPIISVGNLNIGGGGKTPSAIALGKILIENGYKVHFVSRGYKGNSITPTLVNKNELAHNVGDEPLLLSKIAPTWVGPNKVSSIKKAIENGADIILLDDGHQSHYIHKDLSIICVDSEMGFGNGMLIPAGPLREPKVFGFNRADIFFNIHGYNHNFPHDKSVFTLTAETKINSDLVGEKIVAFAGIAIPKKFNRSLKKMGLSILDFVSFSDHHFYSEEDIDHLFAIANRLNAKLCTTEKDWVRLPKQIREKVYYVDYRLTFEDSSAVLDLIKAKLKLSH